jgi:copper chaperone CopZ
LDKLPGIKKVIVRFKTKHCFVRFDSRKQSVKSLIAAIKKAGHEAKVDPKAKWPK